MVYIGLYWHILVYNWFIVGLYWFIIGLCWFVFGWFPQNINWHQMGQCNVNFYLRLDCAEQPATLSGSRRNGKQLTYCTVDPGRGADVRVPDGSAVARLGSNQSCHNWQSDCFLQGPITDSAI